MLTLVMEIYLSPTHLVSSAMCVPLVNLKICLEIISNINDNFSGIYGKLYISIPVVFVQLDVSLRTSLFHKFAIFGRVDDIWR